MSRAISTSRNFRRKALTAGAESELASSVARFHR
jgi:hypothetical protein